MKTMCLHGVPRYYQLYFTMHSPPKYQQVTQPVIIITPILRVRKNCMKSEKEKVKGLTENTDSIGLLPPHPHLDNSLGPCHLYFFKAP